MNKYEYSVLRYLHDRNTGEFINVGIILHSQSKNILLSKFIDSSKRLSEFFNGVDGRRVKAQIISMESTVREINRKINEELNLEGFSNLQYICREVLPVDDSALIFSDIRRGRTLNINLSVNKLFDEMVSKYDSERSKGSISDEDIWRNIYKKHFDEKRITDKLKAKEISTAHDNIKFEYCWQNGKINIFKPISFSLLNKEITKNKIYKWDGKLRELLTSNTEININFLTQRLSSEDDENIFRLIEDKLLINEHNLKSSLIYETDVESFTNSLRDQMEKHP